MKNFSAFGAGLIGSRLMAIGPVKPDSWCGLLLLRHARTSSDLLFEIDRNQKITPVLAAKDALDKTLVQAECFA